MFSSALRSLHIRISLDLMPKEWLKDAWSDGSHWESIVLTMAYQGVPRSMAMTYLMVDLSGHFNDLNDSGNREDSEKSGKFYQQGGHW